MLGVFFICTDITAQPIPFGDSNDSLLTPDGLYHYIYYYKPTGYDSVNGSILWTIHGDNGSGASMRNGLKFMADSRNAIIVSPTMAGGYHFGFSVSTALSVIDTSLPGDAFWYPIIFKVIYKHILAREKRDSITAYLTGWSRGAQCVTRYMLIRQAIWDSIPIRMAVSVSPCGYTFCTDSLSGVKMRYPFGLNGRLFGSFGVEFICNEHVISYYNENYAVMIGTADSGCGCGWPEECAQGINRYERAKNFYAFSQSDYLNRCIVMPPEPSPCLSATFNWQYAEVPGIGHDPWAMYYAKEDSTDSSTIIEKILFDSPYYPPTVFPPTSGFIYWQEDSICNVFKFASLCWLNRFPNTLLWDFGDGINSSEFEPLHIYSDSGTYSVTLTTTNSVGSDILTQNVTIDNPPPVQPDFYADTTILSLPNATVQFYNSSINAVSYLWDFGDSTTTNEQNPQHQYTITDTFTVTLTAFSNSGCSNKMVKKNYIIVKQGIGISEQDDNAETFFIHPTVSLDGKFSVQIKQNPFIKSFIEVYNIPGERVYEVPMNSSHTILDLSHLSTGMYYVKYVIAKGEYEVKKIILINNNS